jgi:glycosyltransferase involved in cell wall biosynthesis
MISGLPGLAESLRLSPEKVLAMGNAIDLSQLAVAPPHRAEGPLRIAYSKQEFRPMHAIPWLVRAVEEVSFGRSIEVHLFGTITDSDLEAIEKSPAREVFRIHGRVKGPLAGAYREMHVGLATVLPIAEGATHFPIKILEHLSQGNPVIASDLPNLRTMVRHEHNGLLVRPGDVVQLASAISKMHDDPLTWSIMAKNALVSVQAFDAEEKNLLIAREIATRSNATTRAVS